MCIRDRYFSGGNAVDAGVATMLAAAVVEFSHFGLGGEAPILVRTKDGKVHAIAGVGTMPKLATAQFFRDHKVTEEEMTSPAEAGGMKNWVPVAGILPALVPGMVEAALVTLREYGTKSFAEIVQPAIELADGFPIDELRVNSIVNSVKYLEAWPDSKRTFLPNGRPPQPGDIFHQPDLARSVRARSGWWKISPGCGGRPLGRKVRLLSGQASRYFTLLTMELTRNSSIGKPSASSMAGCTISANDLVPYSRN